MVNIPLHNLQGRASDSRLVKRGGLLERPHQGKVRWSLPHWIQSKLPPGTKQNQKTEYFTKQFVRVKQKWGQQVIVHTQLAAEIIYCQGAIKAGV